MANLFSPSVNILRDAAQPLAYRPRPTRGSCSGSWPTTTARACRSFNIVGAYGTGKSAFLWAFTQTLTGQHPYFTAENDWLAGRAVRVEAFVGEVASLPRNLRPSLRARRLGRYHVGRDSPGWTRTTAPAQARRWCCWWMSSASFWSCAAQDNPEQELYFIQELAEYVNDAGKDLLLLTTVHQDVSAYAVALSRAQRQEWEKVKGRLKELTFNEPVEQLLLLAAGQLAAAHQPTAPNRATNKRLLSAIAQARVFGLRDYFTADMHARQAVAAGFRCRRPCWCRRCSATGRMNGRCFSFLRPNDYLGLEQFGRRRRLLRREPGVPIT
ncbi:MAG: hypothetical protein WKG07_26580 [Hymenobacter sp.]